MKRLHVDALTVALAALLVFVASLRWRRCGPRLDRAAARRGVRGRHGRGYAGVTRRLWWFLPLAALACCAALLPARCQPAPLPIPGPSLHLHDSVRAQRWADSAALVEYGRTVERMRGDSLAALLAARAVVWRTRWLPARVDTLIARDTVRDSVLVAGADLRACLLADSALVVRVDSLAGELVQARYDADACAEELQKRPTSCHGWSAFGAGVAVGATAGLGACLLAR